MIPKVASCIHAVRNGVGRAHILDGRIAHVLLLEIFTDEGIGTMVMQRTNGTAVSAIASARPRRSPFMPVFAPPPASFVRGSGTELWDDRRQPLPRLPVRPRRDVARSRQPGRSPRRSRPRRRRCCTSATSSPTRRRSAAARRDQRAARRSDRVLGGRTFFTNSGAEAVECAIKLARKFGGRGRHTVVSALGSFHGRTLAALAATGQPTKHEPFQPMPEGFRHVAFGDVDALRAAVDGSVAAVLIEPIQGEGGVRSGAARLPRRDPASCATRPAR